MKSKSEARLQNGDLVYASTVGGMERKYPNGVIGFITSLETYGGLEVQGTLIIVVADKYDSWMVGTESCHKIYKQHMPFWIKYYGLAEGQYPKH